MRVPVILNKTIAFRGKDNVLRNAWTLDKVKTDAHEAFFYIESICNAWFSFEITARFMVSSFFLSLLDFSQDFASHVVIPLQVEYHFFVGLRVYTPS
jgi:hypothetical protein